MKKRILLIGNGPSTRALADVGFDRLPRGLHTFGMGAAYRYYQQVNWWPDIYAWCDQKVCFSHWQSLKALTENPRVSTKKFFFSLPVSDSPKLGVVPHSSTGDFCLQKAIELGYETVYLIGMEGDYVEELPESRPLSEYEKERYGNGMLTMPEEYRESLRIITKTPEHNPNYFFDDYQRAGDCYSLPKSNIHRSGWTRMAQFAKEKQVKVINLSPISKITDFPKAKLTTILRDDSLWHRFKKRIRHRLSPQELEATRQVAVPRSTFQSRPHRRWKKTSYRGNALTDDSSRR